MSHEHHNHSTSNIKVAFWLNFVFTIIEIIGGFYTNSIAILSDALHDFGDTVALGLAWFLDKFSKKKRDKRYSYGYGRFSLLAAFINGLILMIGSVFILYEAIPRLFNPVQPDANGMMWLAIGGIVFNGAAVFKMKSGKTQNEKIVSWHLMEDVLGWIAVFIGSLVMMFWKVPIVDALLSVGFTLFIFYNVFKNFIGTVRIFLQAKPENVNEKEVVNKVLNLPKVTSVHDTHLWSIDGEKTVFTLHVVTGSGLTTPEIITLKKSIRSIAAQNSIDHITVEVEFENEDCALEDC
ncbi:MAG: cation diffusion facilitator family transporter [Cyclobacteriaceae bacterium]|nr:cation diffusion facilitator family transporter [Cyclobacteriaceae bacterium]